MHLRLGITPSGSPLVRGRVAAAMLLAFLALRAEAQQPAASQAATAQPATAPRLTIDYGDGVEKTFTQLPWREGATVLDLLTAASKHPRGVKILQRGSGSTAFIREIDGLANQGGGHDSRNWLFTVNSKMSEVGCGACPVGRQDHVVWSFSAAKPD